MKRYLSGNNQESFLEDFKFLFEKIIKSGGELDLKLRNNYFNLYYRGNSLAKVNFTKKKGEYTITIHHKFVPDKISGGQGSSKPTPTGSYKTFTIASKDLKSFFQQKYLKAISRKITQVNYGEEIAFEQTLITDNLNREDFIIIDRQVTETGMKRRIDLLALKHKKNNEFQFIVLEVKLGKNDELQGEVAKQLRFYVDHINNNFDGWKECYEKNYKQMKETKILKKPDYDSIQIVGPAKGLIVVGGYSGIAKESIKQLKKKNAGFEIRECFHIL